MGPRQIDAQINAVIQAIVADTDTGRRCDMAARYAAYFVEELAWELGRVDSDQRRYFLRDGLTSVRRKIDHLQGAATPADRYEQALADVEAFARHWAWLEDGEHGTGEAFTVAWVVDLIRRGVRAESHDDERGERTWQRLQRTIAEHRRYEDALGAEASEAGSPPPA